MPENTDEEFLEILFNEVLEDNLSISNPKEIYYPFMNNWTIDDYVSFSVSTAIKLIQELYNKKRIDIKDECGFSSTSALQRLTNAIGRINTLIPFIYYHSNLSLDSIHLMLPQRISVEVGQHPYIIRYTNDQKLDQKVFSLKHNQYKYFIKLVFSTQFNDFKFFDTPFNSDSTTKVYHIFAVIRKVLSLTDKNRYKKITLKEVLNYNHYQLLYFFENKQIGTISTLLQLTDYYFHCGIDPITLYQAFDNPSQLDKLNIYVHNPELYRLFDEKSIFIHHLNVKTKVDIMLCPKSLT